MPSWPFKHHGCKPPRGFWSLTRVSKAGSQQWICWHWHGKWGDTLYVCSMGKECIAPHMKEGTVFLSFARSHDLILLHLLGSKMHPLRGQRSWQTGKQETSYQWERLLCWEVPLSGDICQTGHVKLKTWLWWSRRKQWYTNFSTILAPYEKAVSRWGLSSTSYQETKAPKPVLYHMDHLIKQHLMILTLCYPGAVNLGCGLARTSASPCTPGLAWAARAPAPSQRRPKQGSAWLLSLLAFVAFLKANVRTDLTHQPLSVFSFYRWGKWGTDWGTSSWTGTSNLSPRILVQSYSHHV